MKVFIVVLTAVVIVVLVEVTTSYNYNSINTTRECKEREYLEHFQNGNIKKRSMYNCNGKIKFYEEYYESGRLKRYKEYNDDTGELVEVLEFDYYNNGNKKKVTTFNFDQKWIALEEYYANGNIKQVSAWNAIVKNDGRTIEGDRLSFVKHHYQNGRLRDVKHYAPFNGILVPIFK